MYLYTLTCLTWAASAVGSVVPPLGYDRRVLRNVFDKRTWNESMPSCLAEAAPATTAPKANPWAPLTPEENLAVWNLLHDPATGLNLTDPEEAKLTDNYVYVCGSRL
jgi:primary-amine oxidase